MAGIIPAIRFIVKKPLCIFGCYTSLFLSSIIIPGVAVKKTGVFLARRTDI
jgi:hypothetical protein